MDTEKQLYKALGNGKLRHGSLLWFLNPWSIIWQHAKWARNECGIKESNLKGVSLSSPYNHLGYNRSDSMHQSLLRPVELNFTWLWLICTYT